MTYLVNNLSWLVPSCCSIIFAIATFCMIAAQHKWQKTAKSKEQAFMEEHQKLQTTQFSIDLFKSRLQIYDGFVSVFSSALSGNREDNHLLLEFVEATRGKQFLFGKDVIDYADSVYDTINRIIRDAAWLKGSEAKTDGEKYSKLQGELQKHKDMLHDLRKQLDDVFRPYLDFSGFTIQKQ